MEITPNENNALVNVEMQPVYLTPQTNGKRRKKKSIVWEHFTIENVGPECRRACCKNCKQSFAYSTGSKVAGTSHLKRHIAKGACHLLLRDPSSPSPDPTTNTPKRRYKTAGAPSFPFDSDRCRYEIARMIILHEYPLHMVEHPGFTSFVCNLQPRFDTISFSAVEGDVLAIFLREKQNVRKLLDEMPGRICLTLDLLNSSQTTGYVFVTGQFIDSEWKIHRKLLNVVMEPYPESDSAFTHAVSTCLADYNIEGRLFSITINQPMSEPGIGSLRSLLSEKNPNVLGGQLLLANCLARSLSSIAREALMAEQETVKKVRDCVKYVKTSEPLEEKFVIIKQELQVGAKKTLTLDDQTQWNTTYEMLLVAFELREVLSYLDNSDYSKGPTSNEWKQVENICTYLKPFLDTANLLMSSMVATTNTLFHEAWKIQLELARAATSNDPAITTLTKPMLESFDKYWKSTCFVLAIAVIMDPRFKMKLVEFSFTKIYGNEAAFYINIVDEGIHELFLEYVALPLQLTNGAGLTDFDMYMMETKSQESKSELDQYLEESLLPRVHEFDVVGWWKLNEVKYPTLSKMARDILTVAVSTADPGSVFDTERREMEQYRCSLRPQTVEAVFCSKDWLRFDSVDAKNALLKMEFPI